MTKKKNFHGITSSRKWAKAYAFQHRSHPYGSVRKIQKVKIAASVTSTDGDKVEKVLGKPDSASSVPHEKEEAQV